MLKRTPLYPVYAAHGARVIDYGGWELPVLFSGIHKEHDAVRNGAGLFDVSHMGEVLVSGGEALNFLQMLTTNDVSGLAAGQCQYSLMCRQDGGVVDDLLVYKRDESTYMIVINASNIGKDLEWMRRYAVSGVELTDISQSTAMLALQGPAAKHILWKVTAAPVDDLKAFRFMADVEVAGVNALVSRTGYTGEDGFELYIDREDGIVLWNRLLEAGSEYSLVLAGHMLVAVTEQRTREDIDGFAEALEAIL